MAWRNTNPSDYAPKSNAIGDALTGFASVYVPAKIAKDKREAEMAYEKEKADAKAAADAAEKAAAQDKKDKADLRIANSIVKRMAGVAGVDPKSITSEGLSTILDDVKNFGGDSAFDIYLKNDGDLVVNPSAFFNTPNTTASVPISTDTGSVTSSTIPITGNAEDADPAIKNTDNTDDLVKATGDFIDGVPDTNVSTNDNLESIDADEKVKNGEPTTNNNSMFNTRLPDLMDAMQKNSTPELASAYYDGLVKKAAKDSRYAPLAAEFKQYVDKISMENPSISDLSEFSKLELEAVVESKTVSAPSKANATLLLDKKKSDIPWETLDDKNYAGFARKFPDFAKEIEKIAIANTRGIFKPEDIGNFTVAQLKAYETSAIPGIEGYRSLIADTLKQKEQEKYQGISDKSTDELIALTRNTMGYDIDVRIMASNMVSARKMQGFDINTLDESSVDVLKAMESDNRIPQINRDLIKKLREGKESSSQSFRYYAEKVSNQSEAITALDLAISENAPKEVITKLTALKNNHTKAKTISDLRAAGKDTNAIEDAVITMTDGTKKYIQARLTNEGKLVPLDESLNGKGTVTLMSPIMTEAFTKAKAQMQKDTMAIANNSANISEALRNSELAISIAENSPMVRNAGGSFAQFATRLVRGTESAFTVAGSLLNKSNQSGLDQATGETVTYITEADFLEGMKSKGKDKSFLDAIVSQDVQKLADETSRFEATMIILAFRSGRIEGQSGNAMSNKDFERLTQMLETKGSVAAFTEQLRGYMKSKVQNYDDKVDATMGSNSIPASFKEEYGFYPVTSPLTFSEFVQKRNEPDLTTAYQNTMAVEVTAPVIKAAGTKDDPILVSSPEEANKYPAGTIIKTPEGQLYKVPQKADN